MYITYEIIKSSRKTIAVEVRQDGSVLVRAPRNCPQSRIDTFLKEKQAWVLAKVEEQKEKEADSMKIQPLSEAEQRLYRDKAREGFLLCPNDGCQLRKNCDSRPKNQMGKLQW